MTRDIFRFGKSKQRRIEVTFQEMRFLLLFVLFQIIVFYPALRNPRPWSDDWTYIYFMNDSSRNIFHDATAAGRPISGFLVQYAHQNDFSTRNPLLLQIFSLTGLLLLQSALFLKLKNYRFSNPMLILTPLMLILMPGIQSYVYFLSCFPYTWACLFGFLSFDQINSRNLTRKMAGYILFVIAFLVYPAGAMFYFLSYFIDFILRFNQEYTFRSNLGNILHITANLLLASSIGMAIGAVFRAATNIEKSSRIEFLNSIESIIDKIIWISTRLFVSEFRIFTVASPTPFRALIETTLVFSLMVFLILKPHQNSTLNRTLNFLMLIFLPVLGAFPNLVIHENQFEFRTLTSTHAMSLILWTHCFVRMLDRFSRIMRPRTFLPNQHSCKIKTFLCLLLLLTIGVNAQQDSRELWIKPSSIREMITVSALQNIDGNVEEPICMVIPASVYKPLKKLGIYSLKSDLVSGWVPEPYMRLKLENFELNREQIILVVKEVTSCNPSSIVIDYSALGRVN